MLDYILYSFSLSITPGPNCISALENASKKGFPKCLSFNLGIVAGQIIVFTICYCLLNWFVALMPKAGPVLQLLGIVYILYLAYSLLKKGKIAIGNSSGTFKTGFILQFLNVKVFTLGITSITTYVLPLSTSVISGYLLTMILPLVCLVSHVTWAVAGASMANLYNAHSKLFNFCFSSILIYQAISNFLKILL